MAATSDRPVANPTIVFREEFDDWALLFDPDTGDAFGINPVSAFIWKRLDGKHTNERIVEELREGCNDVPDEVSAHVEEFIDDLVARGFAGYETEIA
jgi:SynChlorMet cassette protein ScmD